MSGLLWPPLAVAAQLAALVAQAGSPAPEVAESAVPEAGATLLLAVVQGLTEFLPISSSGHLVLFGEALGIEDEGLLLSVALHVGTLLAVLVVYRRDVLAIAADLFRGRPREAGLVVLGTIPAGVVGLALGDWLESRFSDGRSAALGLFVTALALFVSDRARRRNVARGGPPREIGWSEALLIGCAQAVAILPGISRSGSTIATGLVLGAEPLRAARFSFLLSIPAILGAAVLQLRHLADEPLPSSERSLLLWGLAVAALVGWAALRALIVFLNRGAFVWFAVYCVAVGAGYLFFA